MATKKLLERLNEFTIAANKTNKTNEKLEIIKKYPDLKEIFKYVNYNQITFGITSKNYKKYISSKKTKPFKTFLHLYKLLDALAQREITGDTAASTLKNFILQYPQYEDLILKIIDKNLKTRTNTKAINKVFPGLVPTFEVALSEKYNPKFIKPKSKYYISRKLDGVRCICFYSENEIKFYSRVGNEFVDKNNESTLKRLYEPLKKAFFGMPPIVLDGEICVIDKDGNEDFQTVMKQIRKDVKNPRFCIFDILTVEEFTAGQGSNPFRRRYEKLKYFKNKDPAVKILEQLEMTTENFTKMVTTSNEQGWEGLMLKRNTKYKSGRSKDLLKYKEFFDEEFKVTGIIKGPFRVISEKTGLEETIETMVAVTISYYQTKVGSGFSIEERKKFYKNPELIVGKSITVQYFEKTKNQDNDDLSLRFPTYKGIRNYE